MLERGISLWLLIAFELQCALQRSTDVRAEQGVSCCGYVEISMVQPRARTAAAGALVLGLLWLYSLQQGLPTEVPATPFAPERPLATKPAPNVAPHATAQISNNEVLALRNQVAELNAQLRALGAHDVHDEARQVAALQKALTACKQDAIRIQAAQGQPVAAMSSTKASQPPIVPAVQTAARGSHQNLKSVIPVLIFTYNRPERLQQTVEAVLRIMPPTGFAMFISQDGSNDAIAGVIERVQRKYQNRQITRIVHERDDSGAKPEEIDQGWQPYYAIAHHYKSSIDKVFAVSDRFNRIIVLEDDMEIAHDFFEFMLATSPLFDQDDSLYCVSGFNDNGKPEHVSDASLAYRSDFFPGLGWMTSKAIWAELSAIWPKGFWDDWMRQPDKRRGRSCIRPEVPRSRTVCTDAGVSGGQFCEHLEKMKVSHEFIPWTQVDLKYLLRPAYDRWIQKIVGAAHPVRTVFEVETLSSDVKDAKLLYRSNDELVALEQQLDIMTDFKDGIPRTAYHGVISLRFRGKRLHLVPEKALYVYD